MFYTHRVLPAPAQDCFEVNICTHSPPPLAGSPGLDPGPPPSPPPHTSVKSVHRRSLHGSRVAGPEGAPRVSWAPWPAGVSGPLPVPLKRSRSPDPRWPTCPAQTDRRSKKSDRTDATLWRRYERTKTFWKACTRTLAYESFHGTCTTTVVIFMCQSASCTAPCGLGAKFTRGTPQTVASRRHRSGPVMPASPPTSGVCPAPGPEPFPVEVRSLPGRRKGSVHLPSPPRTRVPVVVQGPGPGRTSCVGTVFQTVASALPVERPNRTFIKDTTFLLSRTGGLTHKESIRIINHH